MVLYWPKPILTAGDLQRHLNGQKQLILDARAVVTPMAFDELRTRSVAISRKLGSNDKPTGNAKVWFCAADDSYPMLDAALQTADGYGHIFQTLPAPDTTLCVWASEIANGIAQLSYAGGVVFTRECGLVCCVANKVAGVRAATVVSIAQAANASLTLAANLYVVEMPGRTFFEMRQILRQLCEGNSNCPQSTAATLRELESNANR